MAQRPTSEQYLSPANQTNPQAITSSEDGSKSPLARPISEIYAKKSSPEDEALEKWFEDLTQYERTLEEMAKASLEPAFKEELGAVENWFSALSEAERTAALYSLIHQATKVQVRFFITVLQKMTKDPVNEALSSRPRSGLQTLGEYPSSNRKKGIERNSMPVPNPESTNFPTPVANTRISNRLSLKEDFAKRSSLSDIPEGMKSSWDRNPGSGFSARFSDPFKARKVPSIDVNAASNWGSDDNSNGLRPKTASWGANRHDMGEVPRPRSATHNTDPNWGNLRDGGINSGNKGRNPNNLTLKVDNVEIKLDSPHWPNSARGKPLKSPAVPPGLFSSTFSPISWAATPTDGGFAQISPAPEPVSVVAPSSAPEESKEPKEPKPLDPVDFDLIENIPQWMRSLRLHKYTPIFDNMTWREAIKLTDEELAEKGVAALGARRKFLKVFEHVKNSAIEKGIPLEI